MTTVVHDLPLAGTIPHDHVVRCVFALPPGVPRVNGMDADALVELGVGGFFIDSAKQFRLSEVVYDPRAPNQYRLSSQPVCDGYWAITGFDLPVGVPYLIPGLPGEAAAPWFRIAPFPHEEGHGQDSRRCYYMNAGVPSIYQGSAPMSFGAPYAMQDTYIELTDVKKVVTVYGSEGRCQSGVVGTWAYDVGEHRGTPIKRFLYVAVSDVFRPRAGDYVPVEPRVYKLEDGTFWAPVLFSLPTEYDGTFVQLH